MRNFSGTVSIIWDNRDLAEVYQKSMNKYFCVTEGKVCHIFIDKSQFKILAKDVACFIFNERELKILGLLARRIFEPFSNEEKCFLIHRAAELLANETFKWGIFAGINRAEHLAEVIAQQLQQTGMLDVCGLERFRMLGYHDYLTAVLSVAADDILGMEEDKRYLDILHSYICRRSSSYDVIHLSLKNNGVYSLLGDSDYGQFPLEGGLIGGFEDLIVSTLLSFAPEKIIVHDECQVSDKRPTVDMLLKRLREIFEDRLQFC